jgi:hypothetical protein
MKVWNFRYWNRGGAHGRMYRADLNKPPLPLQRHGAGRAMEEIAASFAAAGLPDGYEESGEK